jgi:hypothetical protein
VYLGCRGVELPVSGRVAEGGADVDDQPVAGCLECLQPRDGEDWRDDHILGYLEGCSASVERAVHIDIHD